MAAEWTEHPFVALARQAIHHYLRQRALPDPLREPPPDMQRRAGVFVSLKKQGMLRGCIGTCVPTQVNIAREIIQNAVSAATADPRFPALLREELEGLEISVDVLTPPERVASPEALDPTRYGVIIRTGERVGVLLPDLPQVKTATEQVLIARRKAGIGPDDTVEIYRFEVERYH
ncbi:MAG: AmmeMemoRadiSam system protein A [Nitrospinae bacterium]|nr:AmmeMemoRadiSam system protein A [Nitrospinota bacterium]